MTSMLGSPAIAILALKQSGRRSLRVVARALAVLAMLVMRNVVFRLVYNILNIKDVSVSCSRAPNHPARPAS
jgi:hypothetical protein